MGATPFARIEAASDPPTVVVLPAGSPSIIGLVFAAVFATGAIGAALTLTTTGVVVSVVFGAGAVFAARVFAREVRGRITLVRRGTQLAICQRGAFVESTVELARTSIRRVTVDDVEAGEMATEAVLTIHTTGSKLVLGRGFGHERDAMVWVARWIGSSTAQQFGTGLGSSDL